MSSHLVRKFQYECNTLTKVFKICRFLKVGFTVYSCNIYEL